MRRNNFVLFGILIACLAFLHVGDALGESLRLGKIEIGRDEPRSRNSLSDDGYAKRGLRKEGARELKYIASLLFSGERGAGISDGSRGADALDVAIDADTYKIVPGDELIVTIWQKDGIPSTYNIPVLSEGALALPNVGGKTVVRDLTLSETIKLLKALYKEKYPKYEITAGLLKLGATKIFVTGSVASPGAFRVNNATRLSEIVAMASITKYSSLRSIKVKIRDSETTYDLFKYFMNEDSTFKNNPYVEGGSTVSIPAYSDVASIGGAVKRPAKYEFIEGETVKDLLAFSLGATPDADLNNVMLTRIDRANSSFESKIISLNAEGGAIKLRNGDALEIFSLEMTNPMTVYVTGEVAEPGTFDMKPGLRVGDLIYLSGGLTPDADPSEALLIKREGGKVVSKRIDLRAITRDPQNKSNAIMGSGDRLIVKSMKMTSPKVIVEGQVNYPGTYEYFDGMTLMDLLHVAGGPVLSLRDARAGEETGELTAGGAVPADLRNCYFESIMGNAAKKEKTFVDLEALIIGKDLSSNFEVSPNTRLVVPPMEYEILVTGNVSRSGAYKFVAGRDAKYYVLLAGPRESSDWNRLQIDAANSNVYVDATETLRPGTHIHVPVKRGKRILNAMSEAGSVWMFFYGVSKSFD